jgi:hypothetical protein
LPLLGSVSVRVAIGMGISSLPRYSDLFTGANEVDLRLVL